MLNLKLHQHDPSRPPYFDIDLDGNGSDLESAVILSLFVDARALPEEVDVDSDRRGFWADTLQADVTTGSKLWLIKRQKITDNVLRDCKDFAQSALRWLIKDEVAKSIHVSVERTGTYSVVLTVVITKADGKRWERTWHDLLFRGRGA